MLFVDRAGGPCSARRIRDLSPKIRRHTLACRVPRHVDDSSVWHLGWLLTVDRLRLVPAHAAACYRLDKGLSPCDVAERSGLSHNAIATFENEDSTALRGATFDQLSTIAAIYGIAFADLLDALRSRPTDVKHDPRQGCSQDPGRARRRRRSDRSRRTGDRLAVDARAHTGSALQHPHRHATRQRPIDRAHQGCAPSGLIARPNLLTSDERERLRAASARTDRNLLQRPKPPFYASCSTNPTKAGHADVQPLSSKKQSPRFCERERCSSPRTGFTSTTTSPSACSVATDHHCPFIELSWCNLSLSSTIEFSYSECRFT